MSTLCKIAFFTVFMLIISIGGRWGPWPYQMGALQAPSTFQFGPTDPFIRAIGGPLLFAGSACMPASTSSLGTRIRNTV
jgi:hypothetical protein